MRLTINGSKTQEKTPATAQVVSQDHFFTFSMGA
jgi:hypothetical protein